MSIYIERKYLGLVQYRLDGFTQKKPDLYNFRCPYCLDSKKNKRKARGFIYARENMYFYRCHNCGKSTTLAHFLKDLDPAAYKEYVLERYTEGKTLRSTPDKELPFEELKGNAAQHFKNQPKTLSLTSIYNLVENHPARRYIEDRRIPENFWNEIYYTDNFRRFMDTDFPTMARKKTNSPTTKESCCSTPT